MTGRRLLVFGGTAEGRHVSEYLNENSVFHTLCVATEYGEEVLQPGAYVTVHRGRMNAEQMCALMREGGFAAVLDATHPYAAEVSANIRSACAQTHLSYLRFLRGSTGNFPENSVVVRSAQEAAEYLAKKSGRIFLTTGSKELHVFTECIADRTRLFARVLPSAEVIASCRALGLDGKQICGMQGPFSAEMNEAMLRQTQADFLVTKDTGSTGGFPEKMEAARKAGVTCVIISRPDERGDNWEAIKERLDDILTEAPNGDKISDSSETPGGGRTQACSEVPTGSRTQACSETPGGGKVQDGSTAPRSICCVGIGMGTLDTLTHEAAKVIKDADIVFGAKRILESVQAMPGLICAGTACIEQYSGKKIAAYLTEHPKYQKPVILMSGDVGFYSGARTVQEAFPGEAVRFFCGISSVVYFASKIPTAWQDAKLVSAHGKPLAVLNYVRRYPKLIVLVSGKEDVEQICRELWEAGLAQVRVTVGSNLSYPQEAVKQGAPEDFLHCETTGLHIVMLENPEAKHVITPGIPDDAFVRGKVPMTKEEIRILSLSKLRLREDSVVYDVGAGTGSVSMEAARLCTAGRVYAVERNPEGISLILENSRRMCLSNLVTVEGEAPQALQELPAPTHAFIGGSSGNMREIIRLLLQKNPHVRIVINTIALESIAEVTALLRELEIADPDIVQISASKARALGRYHLMQAINPVYIIAFGGGKP